MRHVRRLSGYLPIATITNIDQACCIRGAGLSSYILGITVYLGTEHAPQER